MWVPRGQSLVPDQRCTTSHQRYQAGRAGTRARRSLAPDPGPARRSRTPLSVAEEGRPGYAIRAYGTTGVEVFPVADWVALPVSPAALSW